MRGLKRGIGLGLLCFFGVLPAAHADPGAGLGEAILHIGLTFTLVIHSLRALFIFGLPKWNWRITLGRTLFVMLGVGLYIVWILTSPVFWEGGTTLFSDTMHIGRDTLWGGAYLLNLLGLVIHIKYCIHNAPAPPAEQ